MCTWVIRVAVTNPSRTTTSPMWAEMLRRHGAEKHEGLQPWTGLVENADVPTDAQPVVATL